MPTDTFKRYSCGMHDNDPGVVTFVAFITRWLVDAFVVVSVPVVEVLFVVVVVFVEMEDVVVVVVVLVVVDVVVLVVE